MNKKFLARRNYSRTMYTILPLVALEVNRLKLNNSLNGNYALKIADLFTIERRLNPLPQFQKCISVSLFCQDVDNKQPQKKLDTSKLEVGSKWHNKYYSSLEKFIKDFQQQQQQQHCNSSYKLRVYLEKQLHQKGYAQRILQLCPERVEVFLMKHNSIGAQPGMLWRYLAFDDKSLDIAFVSDIDVDFNDHVIRKLNLFENSKESVFGRFLGWHDHNFAINAKDPKSPLNYAVCLGSCIAMRPKLFIHPFTVKRTMVNYILHRIQRIRYSKTPWEELDGYNTRRFNKPVGKHTYGWGNFWTMYGFDEKFFKHTLFPFFIERGLVQTWTSAGNLDNNLPPSHPFWIDVNYARAFGNPIDYIK